MISQDSLKKGLRKNLFWDVSFDQLDVERDAMFIVARVMNRGIQCEVDLVRSWYGDDRIKEFLLSAPDLSPRTIAYFANYYNLDRMGFHASARRNTHTWEH